MPWWGLLVVATGVTAQLPMDDPVVEPSGVKDPTGSVYVQHSLIKPFFAPDGISIPNWNWIGNTVVTDEYIRLTPDRQTKRGAVWNVLPFSGQSWEATIHFSVNGQGKALFGDGFAFWYTAAHGELGTALGNTEKVNGLGVLFDTYDNHQEDHGHPWVSALINDGDGVYSHDEDGKQVTRGGCQSFFRNMDHPTFARVTYWHDLQFLEVKMRVAEEPEWTPCFTEKNIILPSGYYFGASASTGDLADNHDLFAIRLGTAPVPTTAQRDESTKAKDEAKREIGSVEAARRMLNMKHMDPHKIVTNHAEQFGGHAAEEPGAGRQDEGGTGIGMYILYIILFLAVGGGIYYVIITQKNKQKFDY